MISGREFGVHFAPEAGEPDVPLPGESKKLGPRLMYAFLEELRKETMSSSFPGGPKACDLPAPCLRHKSPPKSPLHLLHAAEQVLSGDSLQLWIAEERRAAEKELEEEHLRQRRRLLRGGREKDGKRADPGNASLENDKDSEASKGDKGGDDEGRSGDARK